MANSVVATGKLVFILAISSVLVLVFGMIFEPMFSIMKVGIVRSILLLIWPNGILLVILIVGIAWYLMEIQTSSKNKGGGLRYK
jgi:hypothetical protein